MAALTLKKGGPTLLYRNWPLLILFSIRGGSKGKLDRPDFLLLFRQLWYFWTSLLWQHRWLKIVTKSIANLSMSSKTWLIAWASQGDVIPRRLSSGSLCVCVSLSLLCVTNQSWVRSHVILMNSNTKVWDWRRRNFLKSCRQVWHGTMKTLAPAAIN